jgi:GNAT superfamily N-acetyltransferase
VLSIRPAISDDAAILNTLTNEFAEFEHLETRNSTAALLRDGFGPQPKFRALIAEWDTQAAGYAIFFDYYSSFRGAGLFLEDLYVRHPFRGKNIGTALFARVAAIATEATGFGVVFNVLDWNHAALDFYKKIGASFWNDWKVLCLEGTALEALAKQAP